MTQQTHVPSRRTVLAGALGVSALGGVALSADSATAALGDPAIPSDPDVGFFLSIPGVAGEATLKGFEGQIELLTWAWGVDATFSTGSGGGGGSGKATPREVIALAESGIQSPPLLLDTNTGRHRQSALISCVRSLKKPFTFMTLEFEEVQLSSYAVTPDPTNGHPLDLIHLVFTRVTYTVIPQRPDGSAGTPVSTSFDYGRNTGS
ncbi:MAG TPA: type VI secretion system tube protein Hcp [Nocardioides sp.]|uniref:Hcp family type VI secretion system effector n=1 Tax=Nocardioides sp. TaxID=35761 RepID=UPI002E2FF856|nr:type VI secretion system tube protein Hcp [Nocardioides sp.]HEX5090265.1 type VI secretion system tube protein Hcp [Nocardioides sp.]